MTSRSPQTVQLKLYGSLVAQMVKRLSTMWETRVQSLGREDLLEKEQPAAVYLPEEFNVLRSLVGYSPQSHKELDMTE